MTAEGVLLPWEFLSLEDNSVNALTCQGSCGVRACRTGADDENRAFLGDLRCHFHDLTVMKSLCTGLWNLVWKSTVRVMRFRY
jgi:hypothetical protein